MHSISPMDVLSIYMDIRYRRIKKRDAETGMWVVDCTNDYNVIPVQKIVCNVHLIPFFESPLSITHHPVDVYSFDSYIVNKYSSCLAFQYFS